MLVTLAEDPDGCESPPPLPPPTAAVPVPVPSRMRCAGYVPAWRPRGAGAEPPTVAPRSPPRPLTGAMHDWCRFPGREEVRTTLRCASAAALDSWKVAVRALQVRGWRGD